MSRTYTEVMQEAQALLAEAEQLKQREVAEVIDRIKQAIKVYGFTASDLGFARPGPKPGAKAQKRKPGRPAGRKTGAAAVKFRDGSNTWVGRGPRPKWLREAIAAGRSLKDFAV